MNPFFFGPAERPLFGVYSHGSSGDSDGPSVLLCYPIGAEYMRAHRAFRQLTMLLNRAGANVLRFDYACTGDSAGDAVDASIDTWLDDLEWALDELEDNAMSRTVSVVGLRWGATLAALAASGRDDVDRLVLWDPVPSGPAYLESAFPHARPGETANHHGYPFSPRLREQIAAIDLLSAPPDLSGVDTHLVVSGDTGPYRDLAAALSSRGGPVESVVVPSSGDWSKADPFGDALIPQRIIQVIVERLAGGSRATAGGSVQG